MRAKLLAGLTIGTALASLALLSPAVGAPKSREAAHFRLAAASRGVIGSFTPAATDPRLAAALARAGVPTGGFGFTPASSVRLNRSVTIAVRAQSNRPAVQSVQASLVAPSAATAMAPVAYNLGAAVGWRKFAVSSDVAKVDIAGLEHRESVDVGVSYSAKRLSTRLQVGTDSASGPALRPTDGYSVDLGTSYSLTRNLAVTVGARYRTDRDRLTTQTDNRRDSQAVYLGTAIRF